jgi:hypothetical protein
LAGPVSIVTAPLARAAESDAALELDGDRDLPGVPEAGLARFGEISHPLTAKREVGVGVFAAMAGELM